MKFEELKAKDVDSTRFVRDSLAIAALVLFANHAPESVKGYVVDKSGIDVSSVGRGL